MDPKSYLKNKSFCPLPWTGFYYEPTGKIKNCVLSKDSIGNLVENSLDDILHSKANRDIKKSMLDDGKPSGCASCYKLEENKRKLDIISSRLYYLKELKEVPFSLYENEDKFNLHHVDVRWQNTCNHACVYCGPEWSSKWERELKLKLTKISEDKKQELKSFIFDNITQLQNVYLAGGEPLLMTENEEFLELLLEKNPSVNLRINTNLSKTGTRVFDLVNKFQNVHWTVSVDATEKEFEYIRYGSNWQDFLDNLQVIKSKNHKISFNMLWLLLNHNILFNAIDYFKSINFGDNSFIIGPIMQPSWLDIRNLPKEILLQLEETLINRINNSSYLLKDSYTNLLIHITTPFESNLSESMKQIEIMDSRRQLNSRQIFQDLYTITERYKHG